MYIVQCDAIEEIEQYPDEALLSITNQRPVCS